MDFLNKAYTQIADLFRSMTPAARLTAGLLLTVIVVALAFLFRFQTQSMDDYLLGGRPFQAGELTAVQSALAGAGLKNWELEGNRIKIPSGQKDLYIAALAESGALPSDWNSPMEKAIDNANPFRSNYELQQSMKHAKQKQLELVISRFRNVEQASVLFDEVEKDRFRSVKLKTASVAVQTTGIGLEESQIRAIRNLLATSYAGLDRANIAITDTTTGKSYLPASETGEGAENSYATAKAWYEEDWKRKILSRLSMIPGVVVEVNAELTPNMQSDTTMVKVDTKPVPLSSQEQSIESTSSGPSQQGRPGAVPNGVTAVGNQPQEVVVAAAGPKSSLTETRNEQNNAVGHEKTIRREYPLVPERVKATIDVPLSYLVNVWKQSNPTPAGQPAKEPDPAEIKKIETQERDRIKEAIVNLLPSLPLANDPYPLVTVSTFVDIPTTPSAPASISEQAQSWLASNWRTLGMFLVGLIGLVMLRGMIRATGAPEPSPIRVSMDSQQASENQDSEEETNRPAPILQMRRKLSAKGPNLREELRQLVKEDPDSAANVLRGWIGEAA